MGSIEAFFASDVAKMKHAAAIAEGGRNGEVRFVGEVESKPATVERLIKKLGKRYDPSHACFEAGPTGWGDRPFCAVRWDQGLAAYEAMTNEIDLLREAADPDLACRRESKKIRSRVCWS